MGNIPTSRCEPASSRSSALDLTELALVPLGFAVGAFGTMVGAGGGFVLVPILLLIYPDKDPDEITAMALFVVWANAVSGSLAYARQQRIDYRSGLWFAAGTLPGAVLGAIVVGYVPRRAFDAIFAIALAAIAVFIFLRSRPTHIVEPVTGPGVVTREIVDREGNRFLYAYQLWKGIAIASVVGFVSSLLGIGGGVIHVPVMATVLHFPIHIAAATSHFVLAFMAGEGTAVHVVNGTLSWNRELAQAALLALGAIPGAQAGAWIGARIHGQAIIRALAVALLLVGARLAVKAIME